MVRTVASETTIMVVDDTAANLQLLGDILRIPGYQVIAFSQGKLALDTATENPPDLILLDVMMPGMDGFEICRRLKAEDRLKHIPVIFISALSDTADKVKAFTVGGVDYVTKPFQVDEILARVGTHLQLVSLQHQLMAQNQNLEHLIAQRTQELAQANARLKDLAHLRDDFLSMISHELRTPANGVLGLGELFIDHCPPSDEVRMYVDLFYQASSRLRNLIDDAMEIARLEDIPANATGYTTLQDIMDEIGRSAADIRVSLKPSPEQDNGASPDTRHAQIRADRTLLTKALRVLIALGACFSHDRHAVRLNSLIFADHLNLRIDLDALNISSEQARTFFNIESNTRSASRAEALALAPVVAHKIITTLGGNLRLVKGKDDSGYLEIALPITPAECTPADCPQDHRPPPALDERPV